MYADGSTISLVFVDSSGNPIYGDTVGLESDIPSGQSSDAYTITLPDMDFWNGDTLQLQLTYNGTLGDNKDATLTAAGTLGNLEIEGASFSLQNGLQYGSDNVINSCTIRFKNNSNETMHKGTLQFTSNAICYYYSFPGNAPPVSMDYDVPPGGEGSVTFALSGIAGPCVSYDMGLTYTGVLGDDKDIMVTPLDGFALGCLL